MRRLRAVALTLAFGLLGAASEAAPRRIALAVNDLAWDAANGRIWASVQGAGPEQATIVAINPANGALGPAIAMGGEAGSLAISDDGSTLYVGVASAFVVRRVDLATQTVTSSFGLGSHPQYGPLTALDIEVQPGTSDVIAVARQNAQVSTADGVAIFDNGVMRPNTTPSGYVGRQIVFNEAGDRLYGSDNGTTGATLETIRVDATGATLLGARNGVGIEGSHFSGGWLFGAGAYEPASDRLRGTYLLPPLAPLTSGIELDPVLGEVYRATARGILVFDLDTFVALGRVAVPFFQGIYTPFVRWGPRSFALQISDVNGLELLIVDGADFAADVDFDFLADSADNCPQTANASQLDADGDALGDACDPTPRPDPFPALQQCAGALAAENATLSQLLAELSQLQAQFAQLRVAVNQCLAANDADGDGEPNTTDRCPGSMNIPDAAGCSRQQFCAALAKSQCKRGDWLNDQPGVKKTFDCIYTGGACVPF